MLVPGTIVISALGASTSTTPFPASSKQRTAWKYLAQRRDGGPVSLVIWKSNREKGRDRDKDLPSAGSLPKRPQWPGLGQSKARSLDFCLGLPVGCRGTSTRDVFCCSPQHISRELNGSGACGTGTGTHRGRWCLGWQLNPLFPSTGPTAPPFAPSLLRFPLYPVALSLLSALSACSHCLNSYLDIFLLHMFSYSVAWCIHIDNLCI